MKSPLKNALTIAILLEMMGVFSALFSGTSADPGRANGDLAAGSGLLIAFELLLYGAFVWLALYDRDNCRRAASVLWPFALILLLALGSAFWSIEPAVSARRATVLCGTTLLAAYCGARYSLTELQRLLLKALVVMVAASCAMFFLDPQLVIDPTYGGSFQGLTGAKNYFAEYVVLLMLLAITSNRVVSTRGLRLGMLSAGIALLFFAHSDTAWLSLLPVALLLLPALLFLRRAPGLAVPLLTILGALCLVIGMAAAPHTDVLAADVGRDPNLTGRDKVWAVAEQAIGEKPLLGQGFDAFWESQHGGLPYEKELGWAVPHSHNGYLETLLGVGACGLALVALAIGRTLRDALVVFWTDRGIAALWPIAFLVTLLLHAITESDLVARHGLPWFLLVALSTQLALRRRAGARLEWDSGNSSPFVTTANPPLTSP